MVTLIIHDNGQGIDVDAKNQGLGLLSMQERAASLNGEVLIESVYGQGTRLVCVVPIDSTAEVDREDLHG